jgi:hypothetical protein
VAAPNDVPQAVEETNPIVQTRAMNKISFIFDFGNPDNYGLYMPDY